MMKIWNVEEMHAVEAADLWKALKLPVDPRVTGQPKGPGTEQDQFGSNGKKQTVIPPKAGAGTALVISLVGAGGKTSTMYGLADELAALGCRVIVTTSTHIFYPADRCVFLADHPWEFDLSVWEQEAVVVVGRKDSGSGTSGSGKLTGLPEQEIGLLGQYADVLLIEADGARCLPLKVPRESEPVLIPETDVVIGCVGLDCIGRTWKDSCLRYPLACAVLGREVAESGRISERDAADILVSEQGTRKGVDGFASYRIVLNKADDGKRLAMGERIAAMVMEKAGVPIPCVISCHSELVS